MYNPNFVAVVLYTKPGYFQVLHGVTSVDVGAVGQLVISTEHAKNPYKKEEE